MALLVIGNIGALYTVAGDEGPLRGRAMGQLPKQENAFLVAEEGILRFAGEPTQAPSDAQVVWREAGFAASAKPDDPLSPYPPPVRVAHPREGVTVVDACGALVTPGLVDPHTHLIYAGARDEEMSLKLAGVPYLQILSQGGGILSTVQATRSASDALLLETARQRLADMRAWGVTTVEIKSGYGLTTRQEIRLLRIVQALQQEVSQTLVPTFLGAHALPSEYRSEPDTYTQVIVEEMIPAVAQAGLARFCDVFCEEGVFSVAQSRRILQAGKAAGLQPKIHADEIEPLGGAALAAALGAVSADHLASASADDLHQMATAGVVAVLLPATSFYLGTHHYAPARGMIDRFNLPVALGTDANPGTSPTESLPFAMNVAALELKMTPEEILTAVTRNAAYAVGEGEQAGQLRPGYRADVVIWQAKRLSFLPYHLASARPHAVFCGGRLIK